MGGRVSFIANSIVPLRAAVSFYGGGIAPGLLDRAGEAAGAVVIRVGRTGQEHYGGASESGDRRIERGEEDIRECRILARRPWIFL